MKLTNLQLEVVTNAIFAKIIDKVEKLKTTKKYQKLITQKRLAASYTKKRAIISRAIEIRGELDALNLELSNIKAEYVTLGDTRTRFPYNASIDKLDDTIELEVLDKLYKDFPSKREIESAVVLQSITGSKDLMNDILAKFNL